MPTNKNRDIAAAHNACVRWKGYDERSTMTPRDMYEFAEWLGDPIKFDSENERWDRHTIIDMSKPEIRRKVELINSSPHWYTILKIYEAKKHP